MKAGSLRADFAWTLIGNVVFAGAMWAVIVVLSRLGSATDVGAFAYASAICGPIFLFAGMQFRGIQATDAQDRYRFEEFFGARVLAMLAGLVLAVMVVLLSGARAPMVWLVLAVALSKVADGLSDVVYGLLQKHQRMEWICHSQVARSAAFLVPLTALLYLTGSLPLAVAAAAAGWFAAFLLLDTRSVATTAPAWRAFSHPLHHELFGRYRSLYRMALPMGIVLLVSSLNGNISRYVIEHVNGMEALGYFTAITYLTVVGGMIVGTLGQAISPRLAKAYLYSGEQFRRLLVILVAISLLAGVLPAALAALWGRVFLSQIYGSAYGAYASLLVLALVLAIPSYLFGSMGVALTSIGVFVAQAHIQIGLLVVSVASNLLLVPTLGLPGAVIATTVSATIGCTVYAGILMHRMHRARRQPSVEYVTVLPPPSGAQPGVQANAEK